jgi:hypothetical protein
MEDTDVSVAFRTVVAFKGPGYRKGHWLIPNSADVKLYTLPFPGSIDRNLLIKKWFTSPTTA